MKARGRLREDFLHRIDDPVTRTDHYQHIGARSLGIPFRTDARRIHPPLHPQTASPQGATDATRTKTEKGEAAKEHADFKPDRMPVLDKILQLRS